MRKILLPLLLAGIFLPFSGKAQGINQMRVQYANPGTSNDLELIAQVGIPSQPAYRIDNSSRISRDTLYVTACYYSGIQGAPKTLTDTISLGSLPPGISTLHFRITTTFSQTQCNVVGSAIKIQTFAITGPTGLKNEPESADLLVYPNPAQDFLLLKASNVQHVVIRDLTGKILTRYNILNGTSELDIRMLKPGAYLLEITAKNGSRRVQRFLKN